MAIGCAGRCGQALLTPRAGLCYNPAMRHAVCVYPETAEALASAPGDFDLELQSFGLGGVRSPRDWRRRAARAFWEPWLERFAALGVTVAFENEQESDPAPAIALLDALRGYSCGFCLDVGHARRLHRPGPPALGGALGSAHRAPACPRQPRGRRPAPGAGGGQHRLPELYEAVRRHCPQAVLSLELECDAERILRSLEWSRRHGRGGPAE